MRYCSTEDEGRDQRRWLGIVVQKIKVVIRESG